jgi:hypothetical protein
MAAGSPQSHGCLWDERHPALGEIVALPLQMLSTLDAAAIDALVDLKPAWSEWRGPARRCRRRQCHRCRDVACFGKPRGSNGSHDLWGQGRDQGDFERSKAVAGASGIADRVLDIPHF